MKVFTSRKKLCIRIRDKYSVDFEVTSGNPQGSVLGLLSFLLFNSGLASALKSPSLLSNGDIQSAESTERRERSSRGRVVLVWADKWNSPVNDD